MNDPNAVCPHCGAKGTWEGPHPALRMLPIFTIPVAVVIVFCGCVTTMGLLAIAPLIFAFATGVVTGTAHLVYRHAHCTACGKAILTKAELARLAPVSDHG